MLPPLNGLTQRYLDDLDRIQSVLTTGQRQVSSGVRVGAASDDPDAVPVILKTQAEIGMNQQVQTNLNQVKTRMDSGDAALQQAIKLIDQAISLGTQGATSTGGTSYDTLLQQAQSIQESLVGIAGKTVSGSHIFSGDLDGQPLYAVDSTQPNGVRQIATAQSTIAITDAAGNVIWRPRTAAEIFDAGDAASGNVFGAVGQLISALRNQDAPGSQQAVDSLKAASEHLNHQLGVLGIAETRLADTLNSSSAAVVSEQQQLSTARDTDVAATAIQLSQTSIQQQAALSIGARLAQKSLFDFMA